MTQMPQSNESMPAANQPGEGEAPPQTFTPHLREQGPRKMPPIVPVVMVLEAQRRQHEMQRLMEQRVRWAEEGAGEPMPDFSGGYEAR